LKINHNDTDSQFGKPQASEQPAAGVRFSRYAYRR